MKKAEVKHEVTELIDMLSSVPLGKKERSLKQLLAYLRVKLVYTLFDLEATRRELKGKR